MPLWNGFQTNWFLRGHHNRVSKISQIDTMAPMALVPADPEMFGHLIYFRYGDEAVPSGTVSATVMYGCIVRQPRPTLIDCGMVTELTSLPAKGHGHRADNSASETMFCLRFGARSSGGNLCRSFRAAGILLKDCMYPGPTPTSSRHTCHSSSCHSSRPVAALATARVTGLPGHVGANMTSLDDPAARMLDHLVQASRSFGPCWMSSLY